MKVTTFIGASAYARIKTDTYDMDVMLSPGHGVIYSLRQAAAEMQEKADQYTTRAKRMLDAAEWLENNK